MKSNRTNIFYAAGPGDAISAHKYWRKGSDFPGQFSLTFSSQIEQFCDNSNAHLYILSHNSKKQIIKDGRYTVEHCPKPFPDAHGIMFHLREFYYALKVLYKVIKFKTDIFIVDNTNSYQFLYLILKMFSIDCISILHCTLWPKGYRPKRGIHKYLLWFNSLFLRFGVSNILSVSPECERQVKELTKGRGAKTHQIRAQYNSSHFQNVCNPPAIDDEPFQIMFVGRVVEHKGVFDIVKMSQIIEDKKPNSVHWHICGTGPDFEKLKKMIKIENLTNVISLHGWTTPEEQLDLYSRVHLSIVPTRSTFPEGLAMVAAESILCMRPVLTNDVVPASEILSNAVIIAETDNVESYTDKITELVNDHTMYNLKVQSCINAGEPFLDREQGLTTVLSKALDKTS